MSVTGKAWLGIGFLALVMGALLFIPAGTVRYWQAWAFLAVFFGAAIAHTLYLMKHDPALLERRVSGGPVSEKETRQKIIMAFVSLGFIALLVVPALDRRFGWSALPAGAVAAGDALVLIGYAIIFRVFQENTFASATIEVAKDQRVISTGPYAIVRHPMYAGALLYLLGIPFALGSPWGLVALGGMMPFLIWRLFDEERYLSGHLAGYAEYRSRVRWRLIPHIF
jgi:protein-S-isoprenylcysteine O-methyltransferase Ste14